MERTVFIHCDQELVGFDPRTQQVWGGISFLCAGLGMAKYHSPIRVYAQFYSYGVFIRTTNQGLVSGFVNRTLRWIDRFNDRSVS